MKEYPTDEELMLFIEKLEQEELYAPANLKEQILEKAFPKKEIEPVLQERAKRVSLLSYRLKIMGGMAAALLLLVMVPIWQRNEGPQGAEERYFQKAKTIERQVQTEANRQERIPDVRRLINQGTRNTTEKINSWFNYLQQWDPWEQLEEKNGGNEIKLHEDSPINNNLSLNHISEESDIKLTDLPSNIKSTIVENDGDMTAMFLQDNTVLMKVNKWRKIKYLYIILCLLLAISAYASIPFIWFIMIKE